MANKPVHEIRNGLVKASIWRNESEKGVFYNTTLEKLYRKGKEWKSTGSYSRDQLLVVSRVSQEANAWIYRQAKRDNQSAKATESDGSTEQVRDNTSPEQSTA